MALGMSHRDNVVLTKTRRQREHHPATSRSTRGRFRLSRIEHLEERTLLSIGGAGVEPDWLGLPFNPFLPPSARADQEPAHEADAGVAEVDEHVEDSLLDNVDSYIPMPTPNYSETTSPSGLGQAVSYDVRTGLETIHAVSLGPFPESGLASGSFDAVASLFAEMDLNASGEDNVALSFTSLSLIDDPDVFPWRVNVKLFMNFSGSNYVASGVLIDPMHVLTAGHCVYDSDEGGWATSITVVPGYEDGAKPYGEAKSAQLHSWTGWTQSRDYDHDIAVIDLDRPIGALTSWYGYGYNSNSLFYTGNTFHNAGYPAASPYNGRFMYYQYGEFDYFIPFTNRVGIWREAFGGQSGSGAYHMSDNSRTVYAVLSNGNSSATNFIRLTDDKFHDIRDDFIADDTPSTFDLIPLNVKVSPGTINSGSAPSSMSYIVHNYSSVAWSGTVNVDVYLSTNNTITTSDTLLQSHSFTQSFSAKGTNTVTVGTPPIIPVATASGNYWIGVIITTTDHKTGNNTTNGWDAAAITVNHVNQAPVMNSLPDLGLNEDASLVQAIDLWAYSSDVETAQGSLTYAIVANTQPDCGVTISSQRYVSAAPTANWHGFSDVTIRVTDPEGLFAQDTFRVTVNPVNDPPVAVDDYYTCEMGVTLTKAAYEGVRVNDSDADGDAIDAVLLSGPANGSLLSFGANGWFSYRPNASFHGTDSFTYRAFEGQAYSTAATVWIQVLSRIPGDADRNGVVDQADSKLVAANWGKTSGMTWNHGDFNADGRVDARDAAILAAHWGQTSAQEAAASMVPAGSEILVGPLQTDRSDLERPLVQPPVRDAVLADDASPCPIASEVDDDVVDLLASRGLVANSAVEQSPVGEAASDVVLGEDFNSIETEWSGLA